MTFWPDGEIFETTEFDYETLRARFQQMAFLNKGLSIALTDERPNQPIDAEDGINRIARTLVSLRAGSRRLRQAPQL